MWDDFLIGNKDYITFTEALKVGTNVFKRGKILEEDIVVVRKQHFSLLNYAKNGIYINNSYLSTSISENIEGYGQHINYIRIPKGLKILYIEWVTATPGEFEVLLPPGTIIEKVDILSDKFITWTVEE